MAGRRWGRRLAWSLGAVLVLLLLLLILAPTLLAPLLSAQLTARAGVPVRVDWISWNPLAGRVALHDVSVAEAAGAPPIVTVGALRIDAPLRRWLRGDMVIDALVIERPWVALRRTANGDFNLAALFRGPALPAPPAEPARPADAAPPADGAPAPSASPSVAPAERVLRIGTFDIEAGSVEFRDETTTPVLETALYLEDVTGRDLALGLGGRTHVTIHLESRLERQPLSLDLTYLASERGSELDATLTTKGLSLARTLLFVPLGWQKVSGALDVELTYWRKVEQQKLGAHGLRARASLAGFEIAEPWADEPTVRAKRAQVQALNVDFVARRTDVGAIDVVDFQALVARDASGVRFPLASSTSGASDSRWRTDLGEVTLRSGDLVLRNVLPGADPELRAAVRTAKIRPDPRGLTFTAETDVAGGTLAIDGRAEGGEWRLDLVAGALALPELAARLHLPVGFAAGKLDATIAARFGDGPVRFSGRILAADVKSTPPDPAAPEEVLAWSALEATLAESTIDPLQIHVTEARFAWPYVMIHRGPQAVFPARLWRARETHGDGAPVEDQADTGPAADSGGTAALADAGGGTRPATDRADRHPLRIDRGTIQNGRIEFYDTVVTPAYGIELANVEASYGNLTVAPLTIGHFRVGGAFDELSPLAADGNYGPESAETRATVDRLLLVPLNAYLEPILQYEITSGSARVVTSVSATRSAVDADNDVVLSRFGLVGAGDASMERELGVPLAVALALMKDTRGDIRLRLPVHGDLNSGQYRVGSILGTALKRALVGAVRTPLRLLGSVFRREEGEHFDLRPVPFAPGSAALGLEGEERVAQVARLLDRHAKLRALLIPDPSMADLDPLRTATDIPVPRERLEVLAAARAEAVARRLVDHHHIAAERVRHTPWKTGDPRIDAPPGVDIQLHAD